MWALTTQRVYEYNSFWCLSSGYREFRREHKGAVVLCDRGRCRISSLCFKLCNNRELLHFQCGICEFKFTLSEWAPSLEAVRFAMKVFVFYLYFGFAVKWDENIKVNYFLNFKCELISHLRRRQKTAPVGAGALKA